MENKDRSRILNKTDLSPIFPSFYQIKKAIAGYTDAHWHQTLRRGSGGGAPSPSGGFGGQPPKAGFFIGTTTSCLSQCHSS